MSLGQFKPWAVLWLPCHKTTFVSLERPYALAKSDSNVVKLSNCGLHNAALHDRRLRQTQTSVTHLQRPYTMNLLSTEWKEPHDNKTSLDHVQWCETEWEGQSNSIALIKQRGCRKNGSPPDPSIQEFMMYLSKCRRGKTVGMEDICNNLKLFRADQSPPTSEIAN